MNNILKSATNIIFALLSLVCLIIVSLGIGLDFSQLKSPAFWLEVVIKWVLTMIMFNIVAEYDSAQRTHDKSGRFYLAFATLKIRIKLIHRRKLYDKLDSALNSKNNDILKELWTERIHHSACTHLCYDDIYNSTDTPKELAEKVRLTKKRKIKRLTRLCEQIRSGATYKYFYLFPFKPIKEEYFLKDNELSKISINKFSYSHGKETFRRNSTKTITFFLTSLITAVITYSFYAPNFWSELAANLLTVAMAMGAGFTTSARDMRRRTQVYENRNDFLERYLNITDVWSEDYTFPQEVPLELKQATFNKLISGEESLSKQNERNEAQSSSQGNTETFFDFSEHKEILR